VCARDGKEDIMRSRARRVSLVLAICCAAEGCGKATDPRRIIELSVL
jgi:hypothetical protein